MAAFEVCELQGMRWVQIRLRDETVSAEAGALSHMQGDIRVNVRLPSPLSALKSIISNEALVRPSYTGTGVINLESSMGGYHPFELTGESWILENGAYWASEGGVDLGLHREHVWTSFWAGEGFIDYQTQLSGYGRVVLNAPSDWQSGLHTAWRAIADRVPAGWEVVIRPTQPVGAPAPAQELRRAA